MALYLIDENLPSDVPFWNNETFIHVSELGDVLSDTAIWQFAIKNNLTIITKDTDFYHRYLVAIIFPKVIWLKTGNMKKKEFNAFIERNWAQVESVLLLSPFVIIDNDKIEGL